MQMYIAYTYLCPISFLLFPAPRVLAFTVKNKIEKQNMNLQIESSNFFKTF